MNISVNRMNPEVKAKWLAALRSGEYKQTTRALKDNKGFCCLGVLCDLHAKEEGFDWIKNLTHTTNDNYLYLGVAYQLPASVVRWADLTECNPRVITSGGVTNLAYLNDRLEFTFNQIADIIEKEF